MTPLLIASAQVLVSRVAGCAAGKAAAASSSAIQLRLRLAVFRKQHAPFLMPAETGSPPGSAQDFTLEATGDVQLLTGVRY